MVINKVRIQLVEMHFVVWAKQVIVFFESRANNLKQTTWLCSIRKAILREKFGIT